VPSALDVVAGADYVGVMLDQGELVARLRGGDDRAFAELMQREGPKLLRVARRLMPTEEDARDCFQESMLKVSKEIGKFDGNARIGTWMYRITVNTCLMKLRKPSAKAEGFIDDLMPRFDDRDCRTGESDMVPNADVLLERRHTRETVRRAIDQLPDAYRAVLILRDIEERPAGEVAAALSVNTGLVHVRLHRARAALRNILERSLFEQELATA
jgi:RNA polymerase sigma-70 factor, ECF subfamily